MRMGYEVAPKIGPTLSRQTVDVDLRHYTRIGSNGLLATRFRGFHSWGETPNYIYFGGNSEMHGYDYLQFVGQNVMFADAELRFPIIEAALTPIGVVGGVRGVFFANIGGGWFNNQPSGDNCSSGGNYKFLTNSTEVCRGVSGYQTDASGNYVPDANGNPIPTYGPATVVNGFRLKDGRASYGLGLETFALGFPIHFDWSWRTTFNKTWEDLIFSTPASIAAGTPDGSHTFRQARFAVWIGYDF
jgi:outer membrane protein assembly factor BamA